MKKRILLAVPVFLAFFAAALLLAPRTEAGIIPLRSGTVVSKVDTGALSYLKAVDDEGRPFWIVTTLCTIGEKGRVDVLTGTRYDKVASDHLGSVLEDVYTAELLKIGDLEVKGFGSPGLPDGCVMLR
jgi:hypothetical protein